MFIVPVKEKGVWRSATELAQLFRSLQDTEKSLEWSDLQKRIPILTSDNRKIWAENREDLARGN